jgi:hypothetical protein
MALESILGAALVYLSQRDDGVAGRLRQVRRTLDGALDALVSFAGRGELVRLRTALLQDFLIGILAARSPRPPGVLPNQSQGRIELNVEDAQHWPPHEGQYDANGGSSRLGELALLGLALTYEETRTFLIGLTQPNQPSAAARQQIGRVSKALVAVVSRLGLDATSYERAWLRLFSVDTVASSSTQGPALSNSAPPDIAVGGTAGSTNRAARGDHSHGHGNQAGGALHGLATPTTPGFLSEADKSKLDGVAAGATATPLSTTAPPNVAATSAIGTATSAARADHAHGHGSQAGGTLHALATPTSPGFLSDADKSKLDGVAAGATSTPLSGTAPPNVAATSSLGTATAAARADHAHGHGDQLGGTLHALATSTTHGFMADVDKAKLNGIAAGATATPLSGAAPPNVAAASSTGTSISAAHADHTHGHGDLLGGTLHALATPTTPGFMSDVDKAKLNSIPAGGGSHLQSLQLCASRSQVLLPGSTFGVDGQVEMLSLNAAPDVCTVAGTLHDFWVEGQTFPSVNVTITLLRAPATGGFPATTPITLTISVGQVHASSAALLAVAAGDRISATSNAHWNHSGLVLRARLRA